MSYKYSWMKPFQRELFEELCKEFDFKDLTAIGNFLGLSNPYHGAKLIFEAKKQNNYLKKMLAIQKEASKKITKLEDIVNSMNRLKFSLDNIENNLLVSLDSLNNIRRF